MCKIFKMSHLYCSVSYEIVYILKRDPETLLYGLLFFHLPTVGFGWLPAG